MSTFTLDMHAEEARRVLDAKKLPIYIHMHTNTYTCRPRRLGACWMPKKTSDLYAYTYIHIHMQAEEARRLLDAKKLPDAVGVGEESSTPAKQLPQVRICLMCVHGYIHTHIHTYIYYKTLAWRGVKHACQSGANLPHVCTWIHTYAYAYIHTL